MGWASRTSSGKEEAEAGDALGLMPGEVTEDDRRSWGGGGTPNAGPGAGGRREHATGQSPSPAPDLDNAGSSLSKGRRVRRGPPGRIPEAGQREAPAPSPRRPAARRAESKGRPSLLALTGALKRLPFTAGHTQVPDAESPAGGLGPVSGSATRHRNPRGSRLSVADTGGAGRSWSLSPSPRGAGRPRCPPSAPSWDPAPVPSPSNRT